MKDFKRIRLENRYYVDTVVSQNPELLGMVGFMEEQVRKYVDEIYSD